jgi:hypothetical protein
MTEHHGNHSIPTNTTPGSQSIEANSRPDFSLTQADVAEFQLIMRDECGVVLDDAKAWQRARELVNLYRMLLAPLPEDAPHLDRKPSSNVVALAGMDKGKVR